MLLVMKREKSVGAATLSKLYESGEFICDVLEDEIRELPGMQIDMWKEYGRTAIPQGTYELTLENSNRFGPDTLTVTDVPGFQYIRIHGGNTHLDTLGCLLPGTRNTANTVAKSQDSLRKLRNLVVPILKSGGSVQIQITNPE